MHRQNEVYVTSVKKMVALGLLGVTGNITPFILPLIVGALVDYVDFSIQQASYIVAADMFGLGVGTLLWSQFILKSNWRKFAFFSAIMMFTGNILCAVNDTFLVVSISRFIAGTGAGLMMTIGVSGLANTKNPDRVVAIYTILVTVIAAIILYVFPYLLVQSGSKGMFLTMSGFAGLAALASFFIPRKSSHAEKAEAQDEVIERPSKLPGLLAVSGVLISFFGFSLFWVYFERAGVSAGFVTSQISGGLGTAQIMSGLGPLTAAVIATRFGNRLVPVMVTMGLGLLASVMIPLTNGFVFYLLAASALLFSWNMLYPYVIGLMISLDQTAKMVTYAMVMMTLGKSLSPLFGAALVSETDYALAYWCCAFCFLLSAILFLPALIITDRKLK